MWRPDITEPGVEGDKARYIMKTVAEVEQRKTNEMVGAELGYRYVDSPIIMRMPGGPEHLFREYIPTTWPGARLPHVWLNDGSAMQDLLPKEGYTLLRLGGTGTHHQTGKQQGRADEHKMAPIETNPVDDSL